MSTNTALYGPGQSIMQVNIQLSTGQSKTMPAGEVLDVVGQVGVPGVPHLAQHGVQAHEVDSRVKATPLQKIALNAE